MKKSEFKAAYRRMRINRVVGCKADAIASNCIIARKKNWNVSNPANSLFKYLVSNGVADGTVFDGSNIVIFGYPTPLFNHKLG
ncbi:MAG: hypothetical protein GY829_05840 [Gammaproteobacteria bacterium]|nr:hypothetical protein [Gammaproteobacteria bacterium]